MQFKNFLLSAIAAGSAAAQNMSLCDKYTMALTNSNNATSQYTVLTLLVNTVVIGSYSPLGTKNNVSGILANGTVGNETVSLLKYFDGSLLSSNRGNKGVSVNFLDDGGAAPLKMNKPANGTSSNQYMLLTHLYEFFGTLLGCSQVGQMGFPSYGGELSMYKVHKFMSLSAAQNTYFIMQVGAAATSFGVTVEDATAVGGLLAKTFNYRCAPAAPLASGLPSTLNSICLAASCPQAENANCSAYDTTNSNGTEAMPAAASRAANGTLTNATASGTGTSGGASSTSSKAAGATLQVGTTVGLSALLFALFAM